MMLVLISSTVIAVLSHFPAVQLILAVYSHGLMLYSGQCEWKDDLCPGIEPRTND